MCVFLILVSSALRGSILPIPSIHRLRRGLLGYLIPFATHAFVSERQKCSSILPSPLVFLLILTHFTATPVIPYTSPTLKSCSFARSLRVEPEDLTHDTQNSLQTLYAQ